MDRNTEVPFLRHSVGKAISQNCSVLRKKLHLTDSHHQTLKQRTVHAKNRLFYFQRRTVFCSTVLRPWLVVTWNFFWGTEQFWPKPHLKPPIWCQQESNPGRPKCPQQKNRLTCCRMLNTFYCRLMDRNYFIISTSFKRKVTIRPDF